MTRNKNLVLKYGIKKEILLKKGSSVTPKNIFIYVSSNRGGVYRVTNRLVPNQDSTLRTMYIFYR